MLPPPQTPRANVLIVDDDAGVRDVCTTMLHVLGYEAHEVRGGEQAMAALDSDQSVKLVLLDLQMPNMDGEEVLRALKQKRPDLRVLMMSGRARGDLSQYLETGADAVLKKPFGLTELDESLGAALNA